MICHARHLFCLLLFSTAFMSSAFAEEESTQWYKIELIAFKHLQGSLLDAERWPTDVNIPSDPAQQQIRPSSQSIDGGSVTEETWHPEAFELAPVIPEAGLAATWDEIGRNPAFRKFAYWRWYQPGLPRFSSQPLRLQSGEVLLVHPTPQAEEETFPFAPIDPPAILIATENDREEDAQTTALNDANDFSQSNRPRESDIELVSSELNGLVTIARERYLHVDINLLYLEPNLKLANEEHEFDPYALGSHVESFRIPILHKRRMRSREVHYLDHPLVGLIIYIEPVDFDVPTNQISNKKQERL